MKEGNGEAVSFFHFSLIRTVGCAEGTLVRQKKQKLSFFLCFVLTYPYRWLRRRYSRSTKKQKLPFFLCFVLTYPYRWLRRRYSRSTKRAKTSVFSLFCAHLSVPLHSQLVLPHIMIRVVWRRS